MVDLNKKHNTTFIFSTHDRMVMNYARRLVSLHDGLIISDTNNADAAHIQNEGR